jgi:hypothetical protein
MNLITSFGTLLETPNLQQPPMLSSLLQLPGAVCDKIHELSLSEVERLYYGNDNCGVGWLCLATVREEEREGSLEPSKDSAVRGDCELRASTTRA